MLAYRGGVGADVLGAIENVSTIGAAPLSQAPLKLDVDVLANTRFFGRALNPLTEGIVDTIDAMNDAYSEFFGMPDEKQKRVLFLPPSSDPSAECFCDETQPTYCPHCSGAMRVLLTDESWSELQSIDGPVPPSARPRPLPVTMKKGRDDLGPHKTPRQPAS